MKRFRKLISLLLVLALALSLCPAVFAEGEEVRETVPEETDTSDAQVQPTEEELPFEPVEIEQMPVAEEDTSDFTASEEPEKAGETEEEKSCSFPGMPEGYVLSAAQLDAKEKLNANNVLSGLASLVPGVDYVDGEVLFLADSTEYALTVAAAYGAELKSFEYGVAKLSLADVSVPDAVAAGADMNSNLPAVEANYIESVTPIPSEPCDVAAFAAEGEVPVRGSWKEWYDSYSDNPELRDVYLSNPSDFNYQYMHDVVNTYEAWGITRGAGVTVAVIDTGVYAGHEDLSANVAGSVCVEPAWEEKGILNTHGTHVAGIIAAEEGNGLGGAGIAPEAKIYSVRVFENNTCTTESLLKALYMTVEAKKDGMSSIKVINMSLGGYDYSQMCEQRIKEAIDSGITVVAAMGNEATNIMSYPAAVDYPGLIAVCSTNRANELSAFSNYGSWADVSAPGSNIMSSVYYPGSDTKYAIMSGTSMATPVVAGICALYLSENPNATPAQVEAAVKRATNKGIVDASLLFASEKSAPEIIPDSALNPDGTLPWESTVSIYSTNSAETIIYTLDGKAPVIKDGKTTAKVCSGSRATVRISSEEGFTPGGTVKIKAASVNALGVMSAVTTYTVKAAYAEALSVKVTSNTDSVAAGKSLTLHAKVIPAEAEQTVYWGITDRQGGGYNTEINRVTGILKVGKNETGAVCVQAYTPDGSVRSEPMTINVGAAGTVKKIVLEKSISLYMSSTSAEPYRLVPQVFGNVYPDIPLEYSSLDWTSSNRKAATVDEDGFVTPVGAGKATITCTAADGSNVKAQCTVNVFTVPDEISISGCGYIAPGKSAAYKAVLEPKNASLKTVVWEIEESSDDAVTINPKTGRLNVPKAVVYGYAVIKARVAAPYAGFEGELPEASITVNIQPQTSAVSVYINDSGFRADGCTYRHTGALKKVQMYSVETHSVNDTEKDWHDSYVQLASSCEGGFDVDTVWSSSNTKVATVEPLTGFVKAVSAGNTTVTCMALDGSGKKAVVTVEVINPVSGMTIVSSSGSKAGDYWKTLGFGHFATNKVVFGDTYGNPSIKKVDWTFDVVANCLRYDPDTGNLISVSEDTAAESAILSNKWVSIDEYGNLSASTGLIRYVIPPENHMSYEINATVTATATDRSGASTSITYNLAPVTTAIQMKEYYLNKTDPDTGELISGEEVDIGRFCASAKITVNQGEYNEILVPVYNAVYGASSDYTVQSGNPNVAGAIYSGGVVYIIPGISKGAANITVKTTDGSNKTLRITLTVK